LRSGVTRKLGAVKVVDGKIKGRGELKEKKKTLEGGEKNFGSTWTRFDWGERERCKGGETATRTGVVLTNYRWK